MSTFSIQISHWADTVWVDLSGELRDDATREIAAVTDVLLSHRPGQLIVNLDRVTDLTPGVLGVLRDVWQRTGRERIAWRMIGRMRPAVRRAVTAGGLAPALLNGPVTSADYYDPDRPPVDEPAAPRPRPIRADGAGEAAALDRDPRVATGAAAPWVG